MTLMPYERRKRLEDWEATVEAPERDVASVRRKEGAEALPEQGAVKKPKPAGKKK